MIQSVATAVSINLTITPTEYSDDFGFDVPDFDPYTPYNATRMYYVSFFVRHVAIAIAHLSEMLRRPC